MAFPDAEQLTQLLTPKVEEFGFDIEHIKTTKAGKKSQLIIKVDGDERPTSDDLEKLSTAISEYFDAAEDAGELNFGAGYTLEVSTPGVDLPLTAPRHWRRNRGRLVAYEFEDDKTHRGRVGALNDDETAVVLVSTEKKQVVTRIERLENIQRAVVEIEFAKVPAAELEATQEAFVDAEENSAPRED